MAAPSDRLERLRLAFLERAGQDRTALADMAGNPAARSDMIGVIHKLAGIAGSLGYPDISARANETERAMLADPGRAARDVPAFPALLAAIEAACAD